MLKSGKTKNVITATNKPNLLPMLEDLQRRFVKFEVYSFYVNSVFKKFAWSHKRCINNSVDFLLSILDLLYVRRL